MVLIRGCIGFSRASRGVASLTVYLSYNGQLKSLLLDGRGNSTYGTLATLFDDVYLRPETIRVNGNRCALSRTTVTRSL